MSASTTSAKKNMSSSLNGGAATTTNGVVMNESESKHRKSVLIKASLDSYRNIFSIGLIAVVVGSSAAVLYLAPRYYLGKKIYVTSDVPSIIPNYIACAVPFFLV
jgi:hypothetical protein